MPNSNGQFVERSHARRRTLKAGVITFSDSSGKLDCTVRDISEGGARLLITGGGDAPETFELVIDLDGLAADCQVRWRRGKEVGVQYVGKPRKSEPKKVASKPWSFVPPPSLLPKIKRSSA